MDVRELLEQVKSGAVGIEDAEKALKILKANGEDAYIMGEIIASEEGVVIV